MIVFLAIIAMLSMVSLCDPSWQLRGVGGGGRWAKAPLAATLPS